MFPCLLAFLAGCGSGESSAAEASAVVAPKLITVAGKPGLQLDIKSLELAGITVKPVSEQNLASSLTPTGEVAPTDAGTVQVTSRLEGKITSALVSVGDRVHKGQILAWVDSVDLATAEAAYQTAVAHANLTKNQLDQQRKLAGYGALSEQPVEDARKAAAAADASVSSDEAQVQVDKIALNNARQLIRMGETTRKPVEDAQNALSQAQSAAAQAQVSLRSAKANLDRAKILQEGEVYSRQQLEDAEAAYNTAVAGAAQASTAENLAKQELTRQETIYKQNLNGASSLQEALAKLQQDQHTYQSDVVAQGLSHRQYQRALAVRQSGIPINQAVQQAEDAYKEAVIAVQGAANTLKLYGVAPGSHTARQQQGRVIIPISAPIDGLVAARNMVVGQNIDTSAILVRLLNLDEVYVDAQVYEPDIQGVSVGDRAAVRVTALPKRTFVGSVKWISNEVNPDTRTVTVRTILRNPGWVLRPGMFASVLIGSHRAEHAVAVPSDAVIQDGDKQVAYVQVAPGQFVKRELKLGTSSGDKVAVESGLSPGDQVVVGGNILLQKEEELLASGKGDK